MGPIYSQKPLKRKEHVQLRTFKIPHSSQFACIYGNHQKKVCLLHMPKAEQSAKYMGSIYSQQPLKRKEHIQLRTFKIPHNTQFACVYGVIIRRCVFWRSSKTVTSSTHLLTRGLPKPEQSL
ncbi:hypothetical protein KP509_26G023600 [Ceratopteris richardii]|uniref:Uncharacterized protein n=1 Tax=Ceratopteris richardii TaxID=49495 RepID=A0A8T2RLI4_CERRI|nr:hypothetical protein KP509_26G023600 [Ceratopteris richardii]